ncbi:TorF family putative porin [Pacificimonas flava]|uniref:Uncharacterized protein n=1 Tax=Pacificimonas flava TaxID=1234595 RepID=M2SCM8_9SPHN|nr:TorF family putative porin [Pacificimonas flava]EMD83130.1 hypothetical protein C725_1728 [Pacificimonas flava]MBB5280287.1 uncharacterized protein (TIGR02001 family) [Pacificimonas flava]
MRMKLLAGTTLAMLLAATPGAAQGDFDPSGETGIPSDWQLSGKVGVVSDYRFRGTSYSDEDPAVQGRIELSHRSGFYAGTWASSVDGFGAYGGGADLQLNLYTGYAGGLGAIGTYDAGVLWYLFPGTDETDFVELYGSVGFDVAGATAKVGTNWAPDQDNVNSNIYLYGDVGYGIPATPITLTAHAGYSDGSYGLGGPGFADNYMDWSLGATTQLSGFDLGVRYVDTDISKARERVLGIGGRGAPYIADAALIFSLGYGF